MILYDYYSHYKLLWTNYYYFDAAYRQDFPTLYTDKIIRTPLLLTVLPVKKTGGSLHLFAHITGDISRKIDYWVFKIVFCCFSLFWVPSARAPFSGL